MRSNKTFRFSLVHIVFVFSIFFAFGWPSAFADSSETPEDRLAGIDGYNFEPRYNRDKCGAHFQWREGSNQFNMEITGGECLQAGLSITLYCTEGSSICASGRDPLEPLIYDGCRDQYGHNISSNCEDADGNPLPTNRVEAHTRIRIMSGSKRVTLTIDPFRVNGTPANEAAQQILLKRQEP